MHGAVDKLLTQALFVFDRAMVQHNYTMNETAGNTILSTSTKTISNKKMLVIVLSAIFVAAIVILVLKQSELFVEEIYQSNGDGVEVRIDDNAVLVEAREGYDSVANIKIPGFSTIIIPAETTNVRILLKNPTENTCNFIYELSLADTGEVLYKSNMILPGTQIEAVALSRALPVGEYDALLKVSTYNGDTLKQMNGVTTKITISAKAKTDIVLQTKKSYRLEPDDNKFLEVFYEESFIPYLGGCNCACAGSNCVGGGGNEV